jgi:hypothetical protein
MSSQLTTKEKLNHWLTGKILYNTQWEKQYGRYLFQYSHRSKENLMGRFGGGWNWNLGFQASGSTLILNLLVASLRITKQIKEDQ